MPRILLIAATTGYQTRSFAEAARRLGIDCLLATDRCHVLEDPWGDHAIPVRFEEPEAAADALADLDVDGIVAVADRPTMVAALTAEKLGIAWHPPHAVTACRDKHRARALFAEAGMPTPRNFRVPFETDPRATLREARFPCVLKPLGLSASRGVIRANGPEEFIAAFERIRRLLEQPGIRQLREEWNSAIQIEEYIEGREFALEGLMTGGRLEILAIFDKPDPLEGPFFEETIYTTPSRQPREVQQQIAATATRAVRALGLTDGPVHAEMRVNARGVWMLEVAGRPIGGLCARALRFAGGVTLEEMVVLHAVGRMPREHSLSSPALGVMMIPVPRAGIYESATGIERARAVPGIDDVIITAKRGQCLVPLPEGASYTGFIFASGQDPAAVEQSLRLAHGQLEFDVIATLGILAG